MDLSVADTMVFFSNSFKLTERLQAEARCDHPERKTPVTVIDVQASETVDGKIIKALRAKRNLAASLTGDELRSWL